MICEGNLQIIFFVYFCFNFSFSFSLISRITLHGFPTATTFAGMSFVTTLPAPITLLSPIVTPGIISAPEPIQQFFPICTGKLY